MRQQKGFTLVELVVVVMILGILAAVAAPKLLGTSSAASENSLKHTLAVVRDAIERYEAEKGTKPTDLVADLVPDYLRGTFPKCPVGSKLATVLPSGDSPLEGEVSPTESWLYDSTTGEFICNSQGATSDPPITFDQL